MIPYYTIADERNSALAESYKALAAEQNKVISWGGSPITSTSTWMTPSKKRSISLFTKLKR
jgi:hypothetical protein